MTVRAWIPALALGVLSATSLSAQKQVREELLPAVRPANAPATIGEFIAMKNSRQPRANVITVEWSTDSFVIPVAGNTPGGGGTYFRSDVVFNNDGLDEQLIGIGWLPQGQDNCSAPLQYFTLGENSVTIADDFVNRTLGKQGLGGLLVLGVTPEGELDDEAQIDGYSRIWTPQPGSNGTTSQNFTAIAIQDSLGSLPATLMGLRQNGQFRANVGVLNMDNSLAHTWTFTSLFTRAVTTVTVPACSMALVNAAANSGSPSGNVAFTVQTTATGFWWSGFGSSTDNTTGDGWVARAIQ
jgi:hypothetical protein